MRLADDVSALQHQAMGGASGRCTLVDHGNLAENFLEVFWLDLALLRGKSGQKSVSLGAGRFRDLMDPC